MSFLKIIFLGFLLWVLLLLQKYLFFQVWDITAVWQVGLYYVLVIIFARVLVRRFGVINFVEAIFAAMIWLLIILILDVFIAKKFLDEEIFRLNHYWGSYVAVLLAVFFLHKKRHIQVRKELEAKHGRYNRYRT